MLSTPLFFIVIPTIANTDPAVFGYRFVASVFPGQAPATECLPGKYPEILLFANREQFPLRASDQEAVFQLNR